MCDSYAPIQRRIVGLLPLTHIYYWPYLDTQRLSVLSPYTPEHSPFAHLPIACFLPHFPGLGSEMSFVI